MPVVCCLDVRMRSANPKAGRRLPGPVAYRVDDLRKAEQQVMASLPDGALMQQAAAGLAVIERCD